MSLTLLTGLLLILLPLAFNILFFMLQKNFEYPDILRKPTDHILRRFHAGGKPLVTLWYWFAVAGLLFTPVAILVHLVLAPDGFSLLPVATTLGIVAGVAQFVGLIRWTFLVPYLAETYIAPDATPATRESIAVVFQAFHRFAGMAIGEHLGYLCTSLWTALIALALTQAPTFPAWLGWLGLLPAVCIFIGLLEESGFKPAAAINAIGYILWSLWLILFGIVMLLQP